MAVYSPFTDYFGLSSLFQNVNTQGGNNANGQQMMDEGGFDEENTTMCENFNMMYLEDTNELYYRDASPEFFSDSVQSTSTGNGDGCESLSYVNGTPTVQWSTCLDDDDDEHEEMENCNSTELASSHMSDTFEQWNQLQQYRHLNSDCIERLSYDLMSMENTRTDNFDDHFELASGINFINHERKFSSGSSLPDSYFTINDDVMSYNSSHASTDPLSALMEDYMERPILSGAPSIPESSRSRYMSADGEISCALCKRNGETKEFYTTHVLKDNRGKVICPILRKYTCPRCKATGDNAHTLRHCPVAEQSNSETTPETFLTRRRSCGRGRRQSSW